MGASWLCAAMAPWAVAPHPNFSQETVDGPGLLGLVAQLRINDYERYRSLVSDATQSWEVDLAAAASASVRAGSVAKGASLLWDYVVDDKLPLGARASAALFASVAEVELDETERAVTGLRQLLSTSNGRGVTEPTASLIRRSLLVQLALREYECNDLSAARRTLGDVNKTARSVGRWEPFRVSRGISWSSERVQRDVSEAIHNHVLMLESSIEGVEGDKWVDVVRARTSLPDSRIQSHAAQRDRALVSQQFADELGAKPKNVIVSSGHPVLDEGWKSLLAAELSANPWEIRRSRLGLGQARILVDPNSEEAVQDGLRLIRLSGDREALDVAISSVQSQGPGQAIANEARVICNRSSFPRRVSDLDVTTVSQAANFLDQDELRVGIEGAIARLHSGHERAFQDQRALWSALIRLLPGSGDDARVAGEAVSFLQSSRDVRFLENIFHAVLEEINWGAVPDQTTRELAEWGTAQLKESDLKDLAARAAYIGGISEEEIYSQLSGLDLVTYILGRRDDASQLSASVLKEATAFCLEALSATQKRSRGTGMSIGAYDPGQLALNMAVRFDVETLWDALVNLLIDQNVDGFYKTMAVDRMTYHLEKIPASAKRKLNEGWPYLLGTEFRDHPFAREVLPHFPEAIRLGSALGFMERDEAVGAVTELAGGGVRSRSAACLAISAVAQSFDDYEWGQVVLLQLTRDASAEVRALAGQGLAIIGGERTSMRSIVHSRLLDLLSDDGIRVPLRTLHGLQRAAEQSWAYDTAIATAVGNLARESRVRVLRMAAAEAIRRLDQTEVRSR